MFLAVNVGNTHVVLGLFEGEDLVRSCRLSSDPTRTRDEYRFLMGQMLCEGDKSLLESIEGSMISSVIPRLTSKLCSAIENLLGAEPLVLSQDLDLGIANEYRPPEAVGGDRLANAVGGIGRYGAPLIIVDIGTATTFDIISADRAYLGGIIMPGLEMGADVLFQKTSLLPRIALEVPDTVIGRSTFESIRSGLVWGTVAAVDKLIERVRGELGDPSCPVVVTGGFCEYIGGLLEGAPRIDADLTLFGILKIWQRNQAD